MTDEIPNEVKTQIGTIIFNEYGNPDAKCTASQWLKVHNFIINSVTKSNIVFHDGQTFFTSRGAVLINNTVQKSEHGKLIFDPLTDTVLPNCEFGQWLIQNNMDPAQITIKNFKFGYKSDQWIFIKPTNNLDNQQNNEHEANFQNKNTLNQNQQLTNVQTPETSNQQNNEQSNNIQDTYNDVEQPKLHHKTNEVKELQKILHQLQMQYIHQAKEMHELQMRQMQYPYLFQQQNYNMLDQTSDFGYLQTNANDTSVENEPTEYNEEEAYEESEYESSETSN